MCASGQHTHTQRRRGWVGGWWGFVPGGSSPQCGRGTGLRGAAACVETVRRGLLCAQENVARRRVHTEYVHVLSNLVHGQATLRDLVQVAGHEFEHKVQPLVAIERHFQQPHDVGMLVQRHQGLPTPRWLVTKLASPGPLSPTLTSRSFRHSAHDKNTRFIALMATYIAIPCTQHGVRHMTIILPRCCNHYTPKRPPQRTLTPGCLRSSAKYTSPKLPPPIRLTNL